MIFHVSIPALQPEHVSGVIARLLDGEDFSFHAFPDGRIVVVGDEHGTAVEVYSHKAELDIGDTMVKARRNRYPSDRSASHFAIATDLSDDDIHAICKEQGWLSRRCDRGPFELIEVWIENRFLMELLPPDCQAQYRAAMTLDNWRSWT